MSAQQKKKISIPLDETAVLHNRWTSSSIPSTRLNEPFKKAKEYAAIFIIYLQQQLEIESNTLPN